MRVEVEHRFNSAVVALGSPVPLSNPYDEKGKPNKHYAQALTGRRWTFDVYAGHVHSAVVIKLSSYEVLGRPTPRHRFKVLDRWSSMDERSYHSRIRREDVPVPLAVQHEAAEKIRIVFVPWDGMKLAEIGPLGGQLK